MLVEIFPDLTMIMIDIDCIFFFFFLKKIKKKKNLKINFFILIK